MMANPTAEANSETLAVPTTWGATSSAASVAPAHNRGVMLRLVCIDGSGRRIGPDSRTRSLPRGASTRAPNSTMKGSDEGIPASAPPPWMNLVRIEAPTPMATPPAWVRSRLSNAPTAAAPKA